MSSNKTFPIGLGGALLCPFLRLQRAPRSDSPQDSMAFAIQYRAHPSQPSGTVDDASGAFMARVIVRSGLQRAL